MVPLARCIKRVLKQAAVAREDCAPEAGRPESVREDGHDYDECSSPEQAQYCHEGHRVTLF